MRKILLLTSLYVLLAFAGVAQASPMYNYNVSIYVEGELINFPDQRPFIDASVGRTYVPVRFVSEALEAEVDWNGLEQKVLIAKDDRQISLTIGSSSVVVNGKLQVIDAPVMLVNNRTMVPLRFVSEVLGGQVNWVPTSTGGKVEIIAQGSNSGNQLEENIIRNLFENTSNENGFNYSLSDIRWQEGAFTKYNAAEALVSFSDSNQCHAAGYSEIWLLSYDDDWKVEKKIADSDWVYFEVLNVENDDKLEVWMTGGGGNQGYFESWGKLVGLDQEPLSVLYSNRGFDYTGAGAEGEALCSHEMDFQDLDNDGILEIIDLEEKKSYAWAGEKFNSEYVEVSSTSIQNVFELNN